MAKYAKNTWSHQKARHARDSPITPTIRAAAPIAMPSPVDRGLRSHATNRFVGRGGAITLSGTDNVGGAGAGRGGGGGGVGALAAGGGGAGVGAEGALEKVDIIVSSLSVQFCHETVSPTVTVIEIRTLRVACALDSLRSVPLVLLKLNRLVTDLVLASIHALYCWVFHDLTHSIPSPRIPRRSLIRLRAFPNSSSAISKIL